MRGTFSKIFGNSPRIRVLEFFLEARGLDYSYGDVYKWKEISRTTAYFLFDQLKNERYIVFTRRLGNKNLYKLNEKNGEVKILINCFNDVLKLNLGIKEVSK